MNNTNIGIYKWTNKINGKIYIGQTIDLEKRKKQFLYLKKRYGGKIINDTRKKYNSKDCWSYEVLEYCQPDELNEKEIYYIDLYNSTDRKIGYNNTIGGDGSIGYVWTDEAKRKVSEGLKLHHHIWTNEERKAFGDAQRGEKNPNYKRVMTDEEREKRRKSSLGENNSFYGKHHTEETKEVISNKVSKPIYQIDKNTNEIVREWKSACEASKVLGISRKGINNCCLKVPHNKTAGGYKWCYQSDYLTE